MKQVILAFWLSTFSLLLQVEAAEGVDWRSIYFIQGFNYLTLGELPHLTDEESVLVASVGLIADPTHHQVIYKHEGEYFLFNTCEFNYWKWQDREWKKMTEHDVSGYNCVPYFFIRNKQPYVLSGSGYWQNQTDLFKLNASTGGVDYVRIKNQPKNFRGHLNFQTKAGIYSLFGYQFDPRIDVYTFDPEGYRYDFSINSWQKLRVNWDQNPEEAIKDFKLNQYMDWMSHIETDNFALLELHHRDAVKSFWLIVDKRDLSVSIKEIPFLQFLDSKWTQTLEGDRILLFDRNSSKPSQINLNEVVASSIRLGTIEVYQENAWNRFMNSFYPLFVVFPLGLMILGGWWIGMRRKNDPKPASEVETFNDPSFGGKVAVWLSKIEPFSGKLIDQDQLDVLFDLSDVRNPDLRKVKRSRAIKAVNDFLMEQGRSPAISRVRDVQDKRVIRYRIELASLAKHKKQPIKIP
ncbi:MAG: hypothetical protein MUE75_07330 [Algoriphagus sp.]|nr:hypothetical protein [Algoriphagus sp.]